MSPKSKVQSPKSGKEPALGWSVSRELHRAQTERSHSHLASASELTTQDSGRRTRDSFRAFTLIEVMVACGIFFLATFAILAMVSATLRNARGLQKGYVDAGMAAAQVFQTFKTNTDPDLSVSGDFGESLRDFAWEAQSSEYDTNGLLQVDIVVTKRGSRVPVDTMTILVYQANVKSSAFGAPRFR